MEDGGWKGEASRGCRACIRYLDGGTNAGAMENGHSDAECHQECIHQLVKEFRGARWMSRPRALSLSISNNP